MPTCSSTHAAARDRFALIPLLAALAGAFAATSAGATPFDITGISTAAQTLATGETGTVAKGGSLTVADTTKNGTITSVVAVTVTGNNATVTNLGTISQTGTGRIVRDNTGVTGLVVNNGSATNSTALMQTYDADVIQMNKPNASVTLNNWGTMFSNNHSAGGSQAVDFNAITSGANVVNNYATGLLKALEADAVRPGVNGVVNNWGTILSVTTTGSSSDGVDAQNNTGVTVNNWGTIEGGRHGITGGAPDASTPFTTTVLNQAGGVIQGDNGSGINLDGFNGNESATVTNYGTIVGNGVTGDGDGVDVDGLITLINTGVIRSLNAVDPSGATAYSEGVTVGGGTITNSGTIEGLVAAGNAAGKGIGITLTGNDITTGPNAGNRDGLYGDATVYNQNGGVIRGQNSSAIVAKGLASGYTVTINNDATSTIQGGGSTDAAIQLGADTATVNNSGRIDGSSSKLAIAGGSGNLTVNISGGQAVVLGNIVGGSGTNTMKIDPGAGNSFAYASGISNFDKVEIASGTVTLTGQSQYTGTTIIDAGATLALSGGANRLAAGSRLDLEGGTLRLANMGGANGQEFATLSLGQDSAIDVGGSSVTIDALGNVVAGKTLAVSDWLVSTSPDYALRFLGNLTHDAQFMALVGETTVDGLAAEVRFDGTYTDVTAVPEPANALLLLAGLGVLGIGARRRAGPRQA